MSNPFYAARSKWTACPERQADPPYFPLGQVAITANATSRLTTEEVLTALGRHAVGDWGDLCPEDTLANAMAAPHGGRLFSAYGHDEHRFWVITEADRSVTTILLPEDY